MKNDLIQNKLRQLGIGIPQILTPNDNIDMQKWSVVACDQYTSQPEYWRRVEELVGDNPSTLHMVLPEIALGVDDENNIKKINSKMKEYLASGILKSGGSGFVLVERRTPDVESRLGLMMCLDLEAYDFRKGSQSLIRATEGTIEERLPVRVRIRENAPLEIPHITVLIDNPDKTVIEPIYEKIKADSNVFEKLYDFELMMGSGHVKGYFVDDEKSVFSIINALENLANSESFRKRYGVGDEKGTLLFAVGDGNHSLASAKVFWEKTKANLSDIEIETHPARYALVEVQNIRDENIRFEPIYRVVFDIDEDILIDSARQYFGGQLTFHKNLSDAEQYANKARKIGKRMISFISENHTGTLEISGTDAIESALLQEFLDQYLNDENSSGIDYVHGFDIVESIGSKSGNMGFLTSAPKKEDLFGIIIKDGILPRKTFSMGEAAEKRFYLEGRKIK